MTTVPNITRSVAAKLAARIRMGAAIQAASLGFVIGAGLCALALPISARLPDIHDRAHWFGAALIAASALIGGAWGWRRSVSLSTGAGRADEQLGLEDRLTSAIELGQDRKSQSPFAEIVIAEAEERAVRVRASRVVALPLGRRWLVGLVLAGIGFAGWAYIPVRTIAPEARLEQQSPEARAAASDAIAETIEQIEPEGPAGTDLASGLSDELEDIRDRLERGEIDADDALAKAAEELEAAASKSEQAAENPAQDRIADAARNAQVGEESTELADALADGDLERARDAAQELLENAPSMPPEARERIARDLESLADALDEASAASEETPDDALTEALRDRLDDLTDPDAVASELEQEGLEPEAARDIAERIAEQERDREAEQRAREDTQRLRDALEAASRDLDESRPPDERTNEQPEEPTDNPPASQDEPAEPEPEKAEPDEPNAREPQEENPGGSEKPGEQPSDDRENSTDNQSADPSGSQQQSDTDENQGEPDQQAEPSDKEDNQDPEGTPSDQTDDQAGDQPGDQPDEQSGDQPAEDQSNQQQESPDPDATKPEGEQPEQQPSEQPSKPGDETEPGADPEQTESEQQQPAQEDPAGESNGPSDTKKDGAQSGESSSQGEPNPDGAKPGKGEGDPGAEPTEGGESGSGAERLRRELDRLSEGQRADRDGKRRARELRRRAQDLLDKASPEEQDDLKELAERLVEQDKNRPIGDRPRSPFGSSSETMDARDPDRTKNRDRERTVSEWFNPDGEAPEGIGQGGRSPEQLRDAVESAERAVEQQRVPPRYRKLVRDVFKRMRDRAQTQGAAPAKQGNDADAGKGSKAGSDDG